MLYVETDGTIKLTRGDTARLYVNVINEIDESERAIVDTDKLTLTIKRNVKDTDPLVQKIVSGSNLIHIEPNDTKSLSFGKYKYDVELTTAEGDVYTVIPPRIFEILEECS